MSATVTCVVLLSANRCVCLMMEIDSPSVVGELITMGIPSDMLFNRLTAGEREGQGERTEPQE